MALTQISTQGIKDGTISSADLADQSVTLAKLPHGTSSNDGKFLRANNGADPTFETVSSIGGGTGVDFDDNVKARFGNSQDLQIFHDSNNSFISESGTGNLVISTTSGSIRIEKNTGEPMIFANVDGAVELYHDGSKKFHTFSEGVTLFGDVFFDNPINAGKDLEWDASQDRLEFKDGVSAVFGASADLQIYHSSNESRIQNTTDKPLKIINGGNAGMLIQNQNSFNLEIKTNAEDAIKCIANAGVELYHNNVKKFETTSSGVTLRGTIHRFEGTLRPNDATGSDIGTSDDRIRDIYVYNDIDIKDNGKLLLGDSNDLEIFHDGTDDVIHSTGTSLRTRSNIFRANNAANTAVMFRSFADGAFEAYHNGSKKFETASYGAVTTGTFQATGNIEVFDNGKFIAGTHADLQIYHNGTNSYLQNSTGVLFLMSDGGVQIKDTGGNELHLKTIDNGAVELYYDGSEKFKTTSSGVSVTGGLTASSAITASTYIQGTSSNGGLKFYSDSSTSKGVVLDTGDDLRPTHNNAQDLGAPSYRWRNIYTNDLNLSNEGSANDVDGTWGSYTIQEGAEDLFLVNKRNGKKYKFNLTEVS